jgi:ribosome-associated protein
MDAKELKKIIVKTLEEKGGGDVKEVSIAEKSSIADYFVIATGKNPAHVKALAEDVETKLETKGVVATRKEGLSDGRWAVVDYNSVIVHIFNADTRDFYALEALWK